MSKVIGIRVNEEELKQIEKLAQVQGLTPSSFLKKVVTDSLSTSRISEALVNSIHEECLEIEAMLTVMQGFNAEVFATMLGRTEVSLSTEAEREAARSKRAKAKDALANYLSVVGKKVYDGESTWGTIDAEGKA